MDPGCGGRHEQLYHVTWLCWHMFRLSHPHACGMLGPQEEIIPTLRELGIGIVA